MDVPKGSSKVVVYRRLYAAYRAALTSTGHRLILEAPAVFQGTPDWHRQQGRDRGGPGSLGSNGHAGAANAKNRRLVQTAG